MPRTSKPIVNSDSDYSEDEKKVRGGGSGGSSNLNKDDINRMVSDVVLYCLITDQKKALIKRTDIVKQCNLGKGLSKNEIDKVMDLVERQGNIQWKENESAQMGLTFSILGLIFMSGGRVLDETLMRFLKNLGIFVEDNRGRKVESGNIDPETNQLFDGDVKRFVNDVLVNKQHYIKRTRIVEVEGEQYEYSWGERAEAEVKKSSVLKFVCELYGCRPRVFAEQFEIVKQEEGDDALESDEEDELNQ